jgi:hypothetical protein
VNLVEFLLLITWPGTEVIRAAFRVTSPDRKISRLRARA